MMEYLKKIGFLGIGIAALTKEKAEAVVEDLVKRGELSADEGKALVNDLLSKSEDQRKELAKKIDADVKKAITDVGVVTRKDMEALEKRISKLEKPVNTGKSKPPAKPAKPAKPTKVKVAKKPEKTNKK